MAKRGSGVGRRNSFPILDGNEGAKPFPIGDSGQQWGMITFSGAGMG